MASCSHNVANSFTFNGNVTFDYSMIKDFYDKILEVCSFLKDSSKRQLFLDNLNENYNFDKNENNALIK